MKNSDMIKHILDGELIRVTKIKIINMATLVTVKHNMSRCNVSKLTWWWYDDAEHNMAMT